MLKKLKILFILLQINLNSLLFKLRLRWYCFRKGHRWTGFYDMSGRKVDYKQCIECGKKRKLK